MPEILLQVQQISKSYFQSGQSIEVLKNLSFELEGGRSLAVVGQSGVGKSTLLHCLGLLDTIDSGRILFGSDVVSESASSVKTRFAQTRRRSIGFVFQFHYLMAELTAEENVMIPLLMSRVSREEALTKARRLLDSVGLSHRLQHRPSQLSGGEQQRVAIARALVHEPKLILADEPTGNLDPKTAERVFDVLKEQCLRLKTILIMATHNHELAAKLDQRAQLIEGALR